MEPVRSVARLTLMAGALCSAACSARVDEGPENAGQEKSAVTARATVLHENRHDVGAPLRAIPAPKGGGQTIPMPLVRDAPVPSGAADPIVQAAPGALLSVAPGLNFEGVVPTGAPPDPNGAVGATQFLEWVNTVFSVYDKSTGALELGPAAGRTFWNGFGGPCESNDRGDVIAQYDKAAARWVAMQLVGGSPTALCLAVSTTSDATGTYNRYEFATPDFPDFPKLGVWTDAYYVSANTPAQSLCALDRAQMLVGAPASIQCFQITGGFFNFLPADIDGSTLPPAGAPGIFLELGHDSASLNLWKFHVDFASPASSTLTGPVNLPVAPFSQSTSSCNLSGCVPQPGSTTLLELISGLHYRLGYRNFGSHESLVVSQSVLVGSSAGMRWYEIRNPSSTPSVFQQGTYAPDANFRWMGSLAMDHAGDMAMGYSVSSSTVHPSIAYTGRVPTDPLGTMESENTIIVGPASQSSFSRWGDYTSMSVDPIDDCTFWYTNEYVKVPNAGDNTRVASFKFPSCASPTDFAVSASPSTATASAGSKATYTFRLAGSGGFANSINLAVSGLPAGASAAFAPTSIGGGHGSSILTVTTSSTTPAGTSALTLRASSGSLSHTAIVSLTVGQSPPPVCVTASPGDGFHNTPFANQSATFAAEFDATPANSPTNTLIGLSNGSQTMQTGFAALVRFNPSSQIDALNGTTFQAASMLTYSASNTYHFRLVVSVASHTYSVFVTPPGGSEQAIATGFAFAAAHNTLSTLNSWALEEASSAVSTTTVCNFAASAGDFTVAATPSARSVTAGDGSTFFGVSATALAGFEGLVTWSVTGLPAGAAASFDPPSLAGSGSSDMSVLTNPSTAPGMYSLTVAGSDGVNVHTVAVALTVTGTLPNFLLMASPGTETVTPGSVATYTATVTPLNGLTGVVNFSVTGLPAGASATFNPGAINGGPSTLTVSTSASTPPGSYLLTITGTNGSLQHSTTVTLVVAVSATLINAGGPAVSPFVADEDFSGGSTINHPNTIDLSGVTNPAPMAVYQSARIGNFTYTIGGFAAGSSHTVRLHFAETFFSTTGSRVFNVTVNGATVLSKFDIVKAAGAKNKAIVEQFTENASASGTYVITFASVVNNSLVSGVAIQ